MNKCKITDALVANVIRYVKSGYSYDESNTKTRQWHDKWHPEIRKDGLWYEGKPLITEEQVPVFIEAAIKKGMPLSRDGAYKWLNKNAWGFKKKTVYDYLRRVEAFQLMKKHPYKNNRKNLEQKREGTAQVLLRHSLGGKTAVGIDLTFVPRQTDNFPREAWTNYKYFYVAVVQANNFTFCYGMKSKTAVASRTCLKKLIKDFQERYNLRISSVILDDGPEFKKEHLAYMKEQGIKPILVSKVWWVERRNSMLMREIAFLREGLGYGFEHAFTNALAKINGSYCRKIKKLPSDVTGTELQQGIRHYNNKLKRNPKQKKQPKFKVGKDRVRHLLKSAMDVNTILWKSYNAFRDRKTHIWSKTVYPITEKKRKGRLNQYLVNGKWYWSYQLQLVTGEVIFLEAPKKPKPKPRAKPAPRKKVPQAEINPENVRRGRRVRKQTVFYGR